VRFLRILRAVLWSFFGVRRRVDAARDLEGVQPHTIVAVGVVVAAVVLTGIVGLVRLIIGTESAPERMQSPVSVPAPIGAVAKKHGPVVLRDTMEERVRPCTVCHGNNTEATADGFSPRIAGKPAGYLFNQLVSFRDGRRTYAPMVYLVQYMTDDYLRDIAAHFSELEWPYPAPESTSMTPQAVARAHELIEHGDAARNVPACSECHGANLAGIAPAIPGLLGLPRHYMNAQFGAWRAGKLRAIEPDCMAEVARRLASDDIAVLTAWLASRPASTEQKPLHEPNRKLPLECGSVATTVK